MNIARILDIANEAQELADKLLTTNEAVDVAGILLKIATAVEAAYRDATGGEEIDWDLVKPQRPAVPPGEEE